MLFITIIEIATQILSTGLHTLHLLASISSLYYSSESIYYFAVNLNICTEQSRPLVHSEFTATDNLHMLSIFKHLSY